MALDKNKTPPHPHKMTQHLTHMIKTKAPHRQLRFVRRVRGAADFPPSRACGEVTFLAICARFKQHFWRFLGFFPPGASRWRGLTFGSQNRLQVRVSGDFRQPRACGEVSFLAIFAICFAIPKIKSPHTHKLQQQTAPGSWKKSSVSLRF